MKRNIKKEPVNYTHCLNCGEELKGGFCHHCGQAAQSSTPKVKDFLIEYAINAFIWDKKFFHTIKNLVMRPGFLTTEFQKGRFIRYTDPLKLNMFLLLIMITMFVMFSNTQKIDNVVDGIAQNDEQLAELVMTVVADDDQYQEALKTSYGDTIMLRTTQSLIDNYYEIITPINNDTILNANNETSYKVVVPNLLLEDRIIIEDNAGLYVFNKNSDFLKLTLYFDAIRAIWDNLLDFLSSYFPLMILFTVPFLSFAVRLVNRKIKMPKIHTFVFSLHFTAFLELSLIFIYTCYLLIPPVRGMLGWIFIIIALTYLTIAQRHFFEGASWLKAGLKSLMINITYVGICYVVAIIVFMIILVAYIIEHIDSFMVS